MRHPYTRSERRHQFFRWRDRVRYYIKYTWTAFGYSYLDRIKMFFNPETPDFVCGFLHPTTEDEIENIVRFNEKNRKACDCWMCKMDKGDSPQTIKAKAKANATLEDLQDLCSID